MSVLAFGVSFYILLTRNLCDIFVSVARFTETPVTIVSGGVKMLPEHLLSCPYLEQSHILQWLFLHSAYFVLFFGVFIAVNPMHGLVKTSL